MTFAGFLPCHLGGLLVYRFIFSNSSAGGDCCSSTHAGESLSIQITSMSVQFTLTLFLFYLPIVVAKLQIGLKYERLLAV